jgi:SET domain-containing protein
MSEPCFYVDDSPIHGKGLFARRRIPAGAVIGTLSGDYTTEDGDHVLWLDEHTGFRVSCSLRYINHSDAPNAAYYDDLQVCALRDIEPGEEITHQYQQDWQAP